MRIERKRWLKLLSCLTDALSEREIIDQSNCLVFEKGRVYTFNDDIGCSCDLKAPFEGAIRGSTFLKMLARLKEDELIIEMDDDAVVVRAKRSRSKFNLDPENRLPTKTLGSFPKWHKLDPNFMKAIRFVAGCASRNEAKFTQTCLHMTAKYVEACEAYQAGRYHVRLPLKKDLLVRRFVLDGLDNFEPTRICNAKTWLHLKNDEGVVLSCRKYEMPYPKLAAILKQDGDEIKFPKYLPDVTNRTEVFAQEKAERTVHVALEMNKAKISVRGQTGSHEELCRVRYDGPELAFFMPSDILRDACNRSNTCRISRTVLRVVGKNYLYATTLGVDNKK